MSATLDGQILQTGLLGSLILSSISIILLLGLVYLVLPFILSAEKLPKLPIALKEEVPNDKERIERYLSDTRELLIHGYKNVNRISYNSKLLTDHEQFKDQVFGVSTTEGTRIVPSSSLLKG
jgi:hypothetical protein